jgi:D-psicose/D-tagatose/L-ribulose 3-epimerase
MKRRRLVIAGCFLALLSTQLRSRPARSSAGFDYVEISVTEIAALSDTDFDAAVERVKQVGFPTLNANLFLPASIRLTGPQATDPEQQMAYVKKAFARLNRLGVKIVCFGSGAARRVPEGFPKAEAFKQLVAFGKRIVPEARANGITIVIEPLRNLDSEKEDPAIILRAREHIRHLHMANPQGRVFPLKWDEFDYAPFFANLRQIGYAGRISIEASSRDIPTEAPQAIALLRRAFTDQPPLVAFERPDFGASGTGAEARRP